MLFEHHPVLGCHILAVQMMNDTRRLFFGSVQNQIQQLGGDIVVCEVPAAPDGTPELRVQRLDGARRVNDPAHGVGFDQSQDNTCPIFWHQRL